MPERSTESQSSPKNKWAIARWVKDEIADAHRETAKKIKTVFETIDADRSGELDMQEFKDAMEMMGSEMDDEAIEVRDHKLLSIPLARGIV